MDLTFETEVYLAEYSKPNSSISRPPSRYQSREFSGVTQSCGVQSANAQAIVTLSVVLWLLRSDYEW